MEEKLREIAERANVEVRKVRSVRFPQELLTSSKPSTDRLDHPPSTAADADLPKDSVTEPVPRVYADAPAVAAPQVPQRSFVVRYAWGLGLAATLVVAVAGFVWQQYVPTGEPPVAEREVLTEPSASRSASPEGDVLVPPPAELEPAEDVLVPPPAELEPAEDALVSPPTELEPEPGSPGRDSVVLAADRVAPVVGNGESPAREHDSSGVAAAFVTVDAVTPDVDPEQPDVVRLRLLAEQGDARAQYELGERYEKGRDGLASNYEEALRWFRRAAEQGHAGAQNNIGGAYREGHGVAQDYEEALRWFRRAVEQGHADAQSNIGRMYMNGWGVPQDYREALRWFRLSAEQGSAFGEVNLGVMHEDGLGVQQNYLEAAGWYRLVAERGYTGGTEDRAIAFAQNKLGFLYEDGRLAYDPAEAVRWFRLAADQGDADAQLNLGYMYEYGRGVRQDPAEAARWYRLAADQGDAVAQTNLGILYEYGRGVRQDPAEAARWYRLAADQGDAVAQNKLGILYEDGLGVRQDPAEAARWYQLAAGQGHAFAPSNLDRLREARAAVRP